MMKQFVVRAKAGKLFLEEWQWCRFHTNYQPTFRKYL